MHAATIMQHGDLLPSEDIQNLIARELKNSRPPVVIEGYPRRLSEASNLSILRGSEMTVIPVFLDVPLSIAISRVARRLVCSPCGRVTKEGYQAICPKCAGPLVARPDDRLTRVVNKRLRAFERETIPLIKYYKSHAELEIIEAIQDETTVHEKIVARIAARCG